jgi:hypothetical protein
MPNRITRRRDTNDQDYFTVVHPGVNLKLHGHRVKRLVRGQPFRAGKVRVLSAAERQAIEAGLRAAGRL